MNDGHANPMVLAIVMVLKQGYGPTASKVEVPLEWQLGS